nr:MAG TPA: hypothetical protein [Caudoviricetes sp.]
MVVYIKNPNFQFSLNELRHKIFYNKYRFFQIETLYVEIYLWLFDVSRDECDRDMKMSTLFNIVKELNVTNKYILRMVDKLKRHVNIFMNDYINIFGRDYALRHYPSNVSPFLDRQWESLNHEFRHRKKNNDGKKFIESVLKDPFLQTQHN